MSDRVPPAIAFALFVLIWIAMLPAYTWFVDWVLRKVKKGWK